MRLSEQTPAATGVDRDPLDNGEAHTQDIHPHTEAAAAAHTHRNTEQASEMAYVGSQVSLISNTQLRYVGTISAVNASDSTITLVNGKVPHMQLHGPPRHTQSTIHIIQEPHLITKWKE